MEKENTNRIIVDTIYHIFGESIGVKGGNLYIEFGDDGYNKTFCLTYLVGNKGRSVMCDRIRYDCPKEEVIELLKDIANETLAPANIRLHSPKIDYRPDEGKIIISDNL